MLLQSYYYWKIAIDYVYNCSNSSKYYFILISLKKMRNELKIRCQRKNIWYRSEIKISKVRCTFRGHSVEIQGTLKGTFRGHVQGEFEGHLGDTQGTFWGHIGTFREIPHRRGNFPSPPPFLQKPLRFCWQEIIFYRHDIPNGGWWETAR